ncbi:MAG: hypothetical protein ACK5SI_02275 [Planctomycetia bacterium]|jgi:plastocyanin
MSIELRRSLAFLVLVALAVPAAAEEWGTVKGRFTLKGDAPAPVPLNANDPLCGNPKLVSEELVVGDGKAMANVVVFVRSKDVKVHPDVAAAAKKPVKLDNQGLRFEPHVVAVQTGQELEITNSDKCGHNSNITPLKNDPSNNLIPAGGKSTVKFANEESVPVPVACNVHPWMKAFVVVRGNPYTAVSKADGTFELKNLPAGELELAFWHEKAGFLKKVTIQGKEETLSKGKKQVKVAAAGTDLGDIVVEMEKK